MMEKFDVVTGVAAPMLMNNINTDLIAPSHFPGKKPEEAVLMTLKDKMFANLRFHPDGAPQAGFRAQSAALQGGARSSWPAPTSAAAVRARPRCGRCAKPASAA